MRSTITIGSSAYAIYEMPSCIRSNPGPDELVMALKPQLAAPYIIEMPEISDSD